MLCRTLPVHKALNEDLRGIGVSNANKNLWVFLATFEVELQGDIQGVTKNHLQNLGVQLRENLPVHDSKGSLCEVAAHHYKSGIRGGLQN